MSEIVETLGYEWRWLKHDTSIQYATDYHVVIACNYRHLVLYRIERWESTDKQTGGIRCVPVQQDEIPIGEV